MRKFIISDIHGLGNVYYSIMGYLDNINKLEPIELYINGDLIDRGIESAEILLDIKKRIETPNHYKITYLGGNHELLMYQLYKDRKKGKSTYFNSWYDNGGDITDWGLEELLETKEKILEVVEFIANLKIYHKLNEKINSKNIVIVHAACPLTVKDTCDLRIKDDNEEVFYYTWTREDDPFMPFRCRIGNKKYFTIVGHTPNNNKYGYEYHQNGNYLNIDGGCAPYAKGFFEYDHYPLVEIKDGYLKILTFNNNNEIIYGNFFKDYKSISLTAEELNRERTYLNKKLKPKKLIRLEEDIIGYEDWVKKDKRK